MMYFKMVSKNSDKVYRHLLWDLILIVTRESDGKILSVYFRDYTLYNNDDPDRYCR